MTSKRIIINSTLSHFLLMFGYKLFSAYFPLYLIQQGLSNPKVGYTYLLIYLPIAICSPIVGALLHKISPKFLSSLGILGYALYSLGLLFAPQSLFFPLQVLLGVSAALFFVSSRVGIMRARMQNYDPAFGWFYSAPIYAEFLAIAAGWFLISAFGFPGVFLASFVIHILNLFLSSTVFGAPTERMEGKVSARHVLKRYLAIFRARGTAAPYITVSFIILLVGSFFDAFYLIFLKSLGWTLDEVKLYIFILAGVNTVLTVMAIRVLRHGFAKRNLARGGAIFGFGAVLMGILAPVVNLAGVLGTSVVKSFGGLVSGSARSGMLAKAYPTEHEEIGAIDTIFAPLATAIGSLIGGFVIAGFGYQALFVGGGLLILVAVGFVGLTARKS